MLNGSETTRCAPGAADCRDAGSAMIMAVLVSVVVFVLGAMWMSIASHESSASNNDRRRQHAIDAAMAGLVVADSELTRNAAYAGSGVVPFVGGSAEFEVTVATVAAVDGFRRLVTSVGYAPSKADPVRTVRTVRQEVDLEAVGFTYGIFTEAMFVTGSASTVTGDVYSTGGITLGNSQDYFGDVYTLGSIDTGSNQTITGSLHANGSIHVTSNHTEVNGSAYAGGDILTGGTIRDTAQAGGTVADGTVVCANVGVCLRNSPPPAVPAQNLPAFVWNPLNYPGGFTTHTSGVNFVNQVKNTNSSGVFYVDGDVNFGNNDDIWLVGDMTIVATGKIALPKAIANKTTTAQAVQLTVISTGLGTAGTITPANNLTIPATVRTLIYTKGPFAAGNSSTFTGVLYAGSVATGANLSVTYAPVGAAGFDWSAASPQSFTIRNIYTREIANTP